MKIFLLVLFLALSWNLYAANLTVSGSTVHVISANTTYDLVTVQNTASLIVTNGATLTVTGALVGYNQSSFLFDNGNLTGRMNITSSKKFHVLNGTLFNNGSAPTDSIIYSDSIILTSCTLRTDGPTAPYYTAGGTAKIFLHSANDIFISGTTIQNEGGVGVGGYDGPKPDGAGTLTIESDANIYIENNSQVTNWGYVANFTITADVLYVFNSMLTDTGTSGGGANFTVNAEEINASQNTFTAQGGTGMPGAAHGGVMYAPPTSGGSGSVNLTAKIVNLADNPLNVSGGNGGAAPYGPFNPGSGGSASINIQSTLNSDSSLYNFTYSLTPGTGISTGTTQLIVNPNSILGAFSSTVEIPRSVLENFNDRNFWSPSTTMGWWDVDGVSVYQHLLIDAYTHSSVKSMQVNYNKLDKLWSFFGGYMDAMNSHKNFTSFNSVRVWVKGSTDLLVKLRDRNYNAQDITTQNMSSASSGMTHLDFNFSNVNSVNLSDIDNVLCFAAPGTSSVTGTFYIDSVELVNTVQLEDFENNTLWNPNTQMGWWDMDGALVYTHSVVSNIKHQGQKSMQVDFNKSGLAWSLFGGYIAGGNPNRNFTAYRKVSFWLYGDVDLLVKLRDRGYHEQDVATVSGVAGQWTLCEVDFSDVTIDKSDIDNILFFAEPGSGVGTGTFYIDDIKLTK